jgi:hypothetical protein
VFVIAPCETVKPGKGKMLTTLNIAVPGEGARGDLVISMVWGEVTVLLANPLMTPSTPSRPPKEKLKSRNSCAKDGCGDRSTEARPKPASEQAVTLGRM